MESGILVTVLVALVATILLSMLLGSFLYKRRLKKNQAAAQDKAV
ncbi:MAG: hypothetical protein ACKODM_07055 [Cytophagales bacterium]